MSRIIINNNSGLSNETVIDIVGQVIASGRISNNGKQYCYLSTIEIFGTKYQISTDLNKKSDSFKIIKL